MRPGHPLPRGQSEGDSRPEVDWWVFDVDGCLVDSLTGTSLRPGAEALLTHLGMRSRVILWSAGGAEYARARAQQFGVDGHVSGFFAKDGRDADGCYVTGHLAVDLDRAVFVDDRPEDLAHGLEMVAVSPYLSEDPHDLALAAVARRANLGGSGSNEEICTSRSRARGPVARIVRTLSADTGRRDQL